MGSIRWTQGSIKITNPTPLRLGSKLPSLVAPPLEGRGGSVSDSSGRKPAPAGECGITPRGNTKRATGSGAIADGA